MHQILNKRILAIISIIFMMITCVGCHQEENYQIGAWYVDLAIKAGLVVDESEDIQQALVDWQIIKSKDEFDESATLTYEIAAYTLANLIHQDKVIETKYIIDESPYVKEIKQIIGFGIYADEFEHFKSKEIVDQETASQMLTKTVKFINNQTFDQKVEYQFDENVQLIDENFNLEDCGADEIYRDENGQVYKVSLDENEEKYLEVVDPFEYLDDLNLSGDTEVDFSNATIEELEPIKVPKSSSLGARIRQYAIKFKDLHHIEIDDYKISYYFNRSSIHFRVAKTTSRGLNFYFDCNLNHIKPTYKWNYQNKQLQDAYFKLSFDTNTSSGFSTAHYKNLYGDFKNLKVDGFKKLFKSESDILEKEITLFKIHLPIEGVPSAEIVLSVKLNLYASGKMEIALMSDHDWGFEIHNGHLRMINENENDLDLMLGANTSSSIGLEIGLKALNRLLMNITSRTGIKGTVKTTFHLYDSQGYLTSYSTEQDYDLLSEVAEEVAEPIYVCGDISLNWLQDLDFNNDRSIAGRLGFNKTIHLLDNRNQVFHNLTHIENGVFMERCSYANREIIEQHDDPIVSEQLILGSHAVVLKERHQIKVTGLPKGYQLTDLVYQSEDETIATVSPSGLIKRVKPGVVKIAVATSDQKFSAYINVLVSDLNE